MKKRHIHKILAGRDNTQASDNILVENMATVSSQEQEAIVRKLKERAARLSVEKELPGKMEDAINITEFQLDGELYGIETRKILEVFHLESLTCLPGTPPFLKGIINVRGKILPVIDLKIFFQLPDKGMSDLNKAIILSSDNYEFGILADRILDVKQVQTSGIEPPLPVLTDVRAKYTKGIAENNIIILDADKITSDKSLIIDESIKY